VLKEFYNIIEALNFEKEITKKAASLLMQPFLFIMRPDPSFEDKKNPS